MEIKMETFKRLLKRVHLGGVIEECVLKESSKEGVNSIQAIDLTNSLILSVIGKTNFTGFGELGFSDLSTLCKFLETADSKTDVEVLKNRLIFKNGNGTFKYLLSEPELIPTSMEDKEVLNKLIESYTFQITLSEKFQKNFSQNMLLTKTNSVSINVGNSVILVGGLESEHQFSIKIGDSKNDKEKYSIQIYGNHLLSVLNVLDWNVEENMPVMMIQKLKPIIIKQNRDCFALTIIENK